MTKTQKFEEALAEAEKFSGHYLGPEPPNANLRAQAVALKMSRRTHARQLQLLDAA